jgi:hypothetical protein
LPEGRGGVAQRSAELAGRTGLDLPEEFVDEAPELVDFAGLNGIAVGSAGSSHCADTRIEKFKPRAPARAIGAVAIPNEIAAFGVLYVGHEKLKLGPDESADVGIAS